MADVGERREELNTLLPIYAFIDRRAINDSAEAEKLGSVFGEYPNAAGWYDALAAQELVPPLPDVSVKDVDDALKALAGHTLSDEARHPQRLRALAALLRVADQAEQARWQSDIAAALEPLMDPGQGQTLKLATQVFNDLCAPTAGSLAPLVVRENSPFRTSTQTLFSQVSPCSTELMVIPGRGPEPVVILQTAFTTAVPTLKDIQDGYLHPDHWPECCEFWCAMDKLAAGPPARYKEVVGFDCTPGSSQRITTFLDFVWGSGPNGVYSLEYTLTDPQPPGASNQIDIDEGSIIVEDLSVTTIGGSGLKITTTKRVRFVDLDSSYISFWACVFGYGDAGQDMVLCSGSQPPSGPVPVDHFAKPATAPQASTTGHPKPAPGSPESLIEACMSAVTACWTETAKDYAASFDKALNGTYRPDDFTKDAAKLWARYMNDMARYMARPDSGAGK